MGGVDTALLLVGVLACSLVLRLVLGGAAWLGLRTRGRGRREGGGSARALLDRRLAAGEIDVEEYFERESALRSAEPVTPPPRR